MATETSNPIAEQARGRIHALAGQLGQLLVVHYDCGSIEQATLVPVPVYCIVVQEGDGASQTTFGGDGRGERQALDDFAVFVEQHPDRTWLHWSMRDSRYGFDAIARRHQYLGGKPVAVPIVKRFDLAQALLDIYDDGYVDHPRLVRLLEANEMATPELLTPDAVAEAWARKEYQRVLANTQRRVRSIRELFVLESKGELRTAADVPRPARHSIDFFSVHWFGTDYVFTKTQAACVEVLWAAWENRTPGLSGPTVLAGADSYGSRLRDVFKTTKGMHPAWTTMIVGAGKGSFQLQAPK